MNCTGLILYNTGTYMIYHIPLRPPPDRMLLIYVIV